MKPKAKKNINTNKISKTKILDIRCNSCGAPAYYDIKKGKYKCRYCEGTVGIKDAIKQHKGFRSIQKEKMKASLELHKMQKAECTGCGAEIVFDENDVLASCAFCGRALVRSKYVNIDTIPELVIPFSITKDEAHDILVDWCNKNHGKQEAKEILKNSDNINGCYLPYELVKGPVSGTAWRIEGCRKYCYDGFIDGEFINRSKKLDNLLLDAMEPYNLEELVEFDFAYVAGHQVKIGDINSEQLEDRISKEVTESYKPTVQKMLETKAINITISTDSLLRRPLLLPVYYISIGNYMAAVNGQTGKVSVRSIKDSYHYLLPWWLKGILTAGLATGTIALAMKLFGAADDVISSLSGCLGIFFCIVMLVAFSEKKQKVLKIKKPRKIYTSKEGMYVRQDGKLKKSKKKLKRPVTKPIFFMYLTGKKQYTELKFTSFCRVLRAVVLGLLVIFLPAIIALFIKKFDFSSIYIKNAITWFCLTVPLGPVYYVKIGRIDIYDNPWIYIINDDGKKTRYKEYSDRTVWDIMLMILKIIFVPPAAILSWVLLIILFLSTYFTAFGFD
ncbi:MAG: hypothetical protein K6G00_09635 [Treponema sp.]|nr:hypothetical protein [Treponema sp.]